MSRPGTRTRNTALGLLVVAALAWLASSHLREQSRATSTNEGAFPPTVHAPAGPGVSDSQAPRAFATSPGTPEPQSEGALAVSPRRTSVRDGGLLPVWGEPNLPPVLELHRPLTPGDHLEISSAVHRLTVLRRAELVQRLEEAEARGDRLAIDELHEHIAALDRAESHASDAVSAAADRVAPAPD